MNWRKVVGWVLFAPVAIIAVVTAIAGACLMVVSIVTGAVNGNEGEILIIIVVLGLLGGFVLVSQEGK